MKLLRLPSGQFFNVETIVNTGKQIYHQGHAGDDSLFTVYVNALDEDGSDIRHFEGPDARALYKWLEANSGFVGEDGNEYPLLSDDRLTVLSRAGEGAIISGHNAESLFIDGLVSMHKDANGKLTRSDDGNVAYVINDAGRMALAVQPKNAGK